MTFLTLCHLRRTARVTLNLRLCIDFVYLMSSHLKKWHQVRCERTSQKRVNRIIVTRCWKIHQRGTDAFSVFIFLLLNGHNVLCGARSLFVFLPDVTSSDLTPASAIQFHLEPANNEAPDKLRPSFRGQEVGSRATCAGLCHFSARPPALHVHRR